MGFNDLSADLVKRFSLCTRSNTMQISTSFTRFSDHERSSKVFVETRPEENNQHRNSQNSVEPSTVKVTWHI